MLKAKHPLVALEEILKFNLWNTIFSIPEGSDLKNKEHIEAIPELAFSLVKLGL